MISKMSNTHIILSDNRKLGYEDYGDKANYKMLKLNLKAI